MKRKAILFIFIVFTVKAHSQDLTNKAYDDYLTRNFKYYMSSYPFIKMKDSSIYLTYKIRIENLCYKNRVQLIVNDSLKKKYILYNIEIERLVGRTTIQCWDLFLFSYLTKINCKTDIQKKKEVRNGFNKFRYFRWYYLNSLKDFEWFCNHNMHG